MTRAMREKLNVGKRPHYSTSNVRVKMPEGLLLQGKFGAKESVAAIFDWMTGCLASPGLTYNLVGLGKVSAQKLPFMSSLNSEGMGPHLAQQGTVAL